MRNPALVWFVLGTAGVCTMLGGCAGTAPDERAAITAPTLVSDLYSQANLRLMLATTTSAQECAAACGEHADFDHRVTAIGAKVAAAAYASYPGLNDRVHEFNFSVVDKTEAGTGSTAGGQIVVLRPVGDIARSDQALSFVLAREVGHVVARHHEENTAVSMAISVLTTVIAPVLSVAKTLAAAIYSSATSFAGSRVMIESYRPRQQEQADGIAMNLLTRLGYDVKTVRSGFAAEPFSGPQSRWLKDLQASVSRLLDKPLLDKPPPDKPIAAAAMAAPGDEQGIKQVAVLAQQPASP